MLLRRVLLLIIWTFPCTGFLFATWTNPNFGYEIEGRGACFVIMVIGGFILASAIAHRILNWLFQTPQPIYWSRIDKFFGFGKDSRK